MEWQVTGSSDRSLWPLEANHSQHTSWAAPLKTAGVGVRVGNSYEEV